MSEHWFSKDSPMKTKLAVAAVLLAVFLAPSHAQAQANAANYAYSTTTSGSLTDMSSGTTTLIAADQDDLASPVTLIGFEFVFMAVRQDRLVRRRSAQRCMTHWRKPDRR
jgi:hypothetical protein